MEKYSIPKEKYSFICDDINSALNNFEVNSFDTVFCFGIFYHTMNHMTLLSDIKKLNPKYVILDTAVSITDKPIIHIKTENLDFDGPPINTSESIGIQTLAGWPSVTAIDLMLNYYGFDVRYFNWQNTNIENWENIQDYKNGRRVTVIAKKKDKN